MRLPASLGLVVMLVSAAACIVAGVPAQVSGAPSPFVTPFPSSTSSPTPVASALGNPFPNPSSSAALAGANGYVAAGYVGGSAGGGLIGPLPATTSTPSAFPNSASTSGFWVAAGGRLSPMYLASLDYQNFAVHGGDKPLLSYAQLRALYEPQGSEWSFGFGYLSAQRSTSAANLNALGLGVAFGPNLALPIAPYALAFFYPHVQTAGSSASFVLGELGVLIQPAHPGKLFVRLGGSTHCCWPSVTSPHSDSELVAGLGSAF